MSDPVPRIDRHTIDILHISTTQKRRRKAKVITQLPQIRPPRPFYTDLQHDHMVYATKYDLDSRHCHDSCLFVSKINPDPGHDALFSRSLSGDRVCAITMRAGDKDHSLRGQVNRSRELIATDTLDTFSDMPHLEEQPDHMPW